jgi:protein SCO1/2
LNRIVFLLVILLVPNLIFAGNLDNLPGNSIYHIGSQWTDQDNTSSNIGDLQGRVQVVAFVYTYCEHSCPFIIANLKQINNAIPEEYTNNVQFSLISLDPTRDSPQVLNQYMKDHNLNSSKWQMLNGAAEDVLELSALLGVRYKPMDSEGNDISHSNMITVLDKQGQILYQLKGLNQDLEQVTSRILNELQATN